MSLLLLQNIPTYPGAQPLEHCPFVELQGRPLKQCPLHWILQSSQPLSNDLT